MKVYQSVLRLTCVFSLGVSLSTFAAEFPPGFENAELMQKLMAGEITIEQSVDTKTEFETVSRGFFRGVGPQDYVKLGTDHSRYPVMFPDVKKGTTLSVNDDRTVFEYLFDIVVKVGPITQNAQLQGKQAILPTMSTWNEIQMHNEIVNMTDDLKVAAQVTRLIPYEGGTLVEDTVHVAVYKANTKGKVIRKQMFAFFTSYLNAFRTELNATP